MSNGSILNELKVECPFTSVMEETEKLDGFTIHKNKLETLRGDFDGHNWSNTIWPYYEKEETPEQAQEINEVYRRLTDDNAFKNLSEIRKFCYAHPGVALSEDSTREYKFFYEGENCVFMINLSTLRADYNLFLHVFAKS